MCAIESGNLEIFELIVKQSKTDLNLKSKTQKNALELALLDMNRLEMAQKLVQKNRADLNSTDSNSFSNIKFYFFFKFFRSDSFP